MFSSELFLSELLRDQVKLNIFKADTGVLPFEATIAVVVVLNITEVINYLFHYLKNGSRTINCFFRFCAYKPFIFL